METEMVKTAYTLLPPPLAAIPAKYWTSISLWLHSYTVARTFQELLRLADIQENYAEEEVFIIGFLHDFVQKLGKTPASLRQTYTWVLERLTNDLGFTPREARKLAKVLETNPAENIRRTDYADPLLPSRIWKLLMLADELQGSTDAITWAMKVRNMLSKEFNKSYHISLYSINLPQPFVRSRIWELIEEKFENTGCSIDGQADCGVLAIASIYGLVVLSREPLGKLTISWDEIIDRRVDETEALSSDDIKALRKHLDEGCNNITKIKDKNKKRNYKEKYQEELKKIAGGSKFGKLNEKYCTSRLKGERAGTYTLLLHYFGNKRDEDLGTLYLPHHTKDMLTNVEITGVEYGDGEYLCPICGARHREGFVAGIVGTISNAKSEKWNRFLTLNINKSLNQMLREDKPIRICPFCMLDMLLATKRMVGGYTVYYTLALRTPTPVVVLREVVGVMYKIINKFYRDARSPSSPNIKNIESMTTSPLDTITKAKPKPFNVLHNYAGATISTNGGVEFRGSINDLKLQDKLMFVSLAGMLAYYGIYPVIVSVEYPPYLVSPPEKLVSYEVTYPLYDYAPSSEDRIYGSPVTPYVASTLASLPILYYDREIPERRKYARHIEEILGFSPRHAPLLLLYSNPELYSRVSSLVRMFIGGGSSG